MSICNLYLFSTQGISNQYGIGTYLHQTATAMKKVGYSVYIVNMNSNVLDLSVTEKYGIKTIDIPTIEVYNKNNKQQRAIAMLLDLYIDHKAKNLFHFNTYHNYEFLKFIRDKYDAKSIYVRHYAEWSFVYMNERYLLDKSLKKPKNKRNYVEDRIIKSIEDEQKMINIADQVVALADHSYNDILQLYRTENDKVSIISNGSQDLFHKVSKRKIENIKQRFNPHNDRLLIFAGRVSIDKGVILLIKAFEKVILDHPNTKLLIVGDGPLNLILKKCNKIWEKTIFTGFVSRKELFELYRIADFGVVPSFYEEFGLVATEMMMGGLPIIVNDTTGLSEVALDGVTGFKIKLYGSKRNEKQSVENLAKTINNALEMSEIERNIMSKAARNRFLKLYNIKLFTQKMTKLYESVLTH